MRIIAGTLKGRRLRVPRGIEVRPTSERVREAIFSMLGMHVSNARVLDLFAGSGALGIEALSRGAAYTVFVERSKKVCSTLNKNIDFSGVENTSFKVVISDGIDYLSKAGTWGLKFDLVFVDPPYGSDLGDRALRSLSERAVLSEGALVVLETGKLSIPDSGMGLFLEKKREYGDTSIWIYSWREGKL